MGMHRAGNDENGWKVTIENVEGVVGNMRGEEEV